MKTIVALVDFSDVAFKVLLQAQTLATAFQSEVVILHVVEPQPMLVGMGVTPTIMREPSTEEFAMDQEKLLELRDSMTKVGIKATADQIQGPTVDKIISETERLGADLIIIGSHGHGALYNLFVGSVTEAVLKRSKCPVLVVPASPVKQKEKALAHASA